ncbi:MAG: hypothetical protein GYB66_16035 [Chloroflexi bacterium]|nr:hypothetical protein [Chloroflexota bacterium]
MRCLFSMIFGLVGLILLAAGGVLLYTVFIDTPEERVETLGVRTIVSEVSVETALDEDLRDDYFEQAAEAFEDGPGAGANVILENAPLTENAEVEVQTESAEPLPEGPAGGGQGGAFEPIEQRVVDLEWPEEFRVGETGAIRLTLKPLPEGGFEVASPEIETNKIISTPITLVDCYDAYDARVTARLVAPDAFEIEDNATETIPLSRGQEASWRWSLTPDESGSFVITVSLTMDWSLKPGATPPPNSCQSLATDRFTFWGQSVQVEANQVFGFITIPQASILGGVLAVLGFVGELPLLSEILGILFERRLERRAERRRDRRARRRRR